MAARDHVFSEITGGTVLPGEGHLSRDDYVPPFDAAGVTSVMPCMECEAADFASIPPPLRDPDAVDMPPQPLAEQAARSCNDG